MNLFELFVKIGVDDQATDHISKMGETLKSGLATAAKVGTAAVTAASGAVLGLAKKATDAYGSFEQLKGGVETLFGSAADEVMKNADKAFATAGVSANNYMETVTSFAASLIQATGRGVQTDIDVLTTDLANQLDRTKDNLDEEYNATKQALAEQVAARKQYWDDLINGEVSTESKKALQAQRDAEVAAVKETNAAALAERKQYWKDVIAAETDKEKKKKLQEQRDADLAAVKAANDEKLASVKQTWADTISADTQGSKDQKKALQAQRDADLASLKKLNAEKLANIKKQNKNTLAEMKQANKEQIKLTESLNNQSTTTEESLQKAAELADMALKDMSDNANKMGTNMASIQNAYQGFAKQNYTIDLMSVA